MNQGIMVSTVNIFTMMQKHKRFVKWQLFQKRNKITF